MPNTNEFIEIRSEEVQDLLSKPPSWILRWGISIVTCIFVVSLFFSWIIKYPEIIHASFTLTSTNAPKPIVAQVSGRLVKLFAIEDQNVKAKQILAFFESTANHYDVLNLIKDLDKALLYSEMNSFDKLNKINFSKYYKLGELQNDFSNFEKLNNIWINYSSSNYYNVKKNIIQKDIIDLKELFLQLQVQEKLQKRDVQLAEETFLIQEKLASEKVLSPLELKTEESKLLAKKYPYQNTLNALLSNQALQRSKINELLELDKEFISARTNFIQALSTLRSAAESWKNRYILISPLSGRVHYATIIQEGQTMKLGQELFFISPNNNDYYGQLLFSQLNFGKVKSGQTAYIKFDGYPYGEYGTVKGKIVSIAEIPYNKSQFLAKISLTNGLVTNYGHKLQYKNGMVGTSDVIVDENRLLEKILYQFRMAIQ